MVQNCQCGTIPEKPEVFPEPIVNLIPPIKNTPEPSIIKDVFIPDDFTPDQMSDIKDALHEWETKTNGAVKFVIFEHYKKELSRILTIRAFSLVILDSPADAASIVELDARETKRAGHPMEVWGYYTSNDSIPTIYIVSSRIKSRMNYTAVVEHELGHSFGLEHNEHTGTLMYESQDKSAKHITGEDLEKFCELHRCLPVKTE